MTSRQRSLVQSLGRRYKLVISKGVVVTRQAQEKVFLSKCQMLTVASGQDAVDDVNLPHESSEAFLLDEGPCRGVPIILHGGDDARCRRAVLPNFRPVPNYQVIDGA